MSISSLLFLFIFLPLVLVAYLFVPVKIRKYFLLAVSLVFYAWGGLRSLLLLLALTAAAYFAAMEVRAFRREGNERAARVSLAVTVCAVVAVLAAHKYMKGLAFPLGISFYTFSLLSYIFDVYREKTEPAANPLDLVLYLSFFPKITSGPIVQYKDFQEQLAGGALAKPRTGEGIELFLVGLFKKVLIADTLGRLFADVSARAVLPAGAAWLGAITFSVQLYMDFSGYSDMAIGLAKMFGFRFEKNFDYPYLSKSVSEFWRRWHISLGAWFRDYVYIPLGGSRCERPLVIRNLLVVWILTGIWHGSTLNFIFWGLFHGAFVIMERFLYGKFLDKIPGFARVIYTDIVAVIGWTFFSATSLGGGFRFVGKMFGADRIGFWNGASSYLFRQYAVVLVVGILCCSPLVRRLHDRLITERGSAARTASVIGYLLLFALCVAQLVGATYTTFLYAQF